MPKSAVLGQMLQMCCHLQTCSQNIAAITQYFPEYFNTGDSDEEEENGNILDEPNVTLRAFNIDFSILGFRSCVPLVADRSNTLNSDWQEPSRLRLTGVSDLAAMATLQEFLHCISMELVLFCLFAVFNLSLLYQYL